MLAARERLERRDGVIEPALHQECIADDVQCTGMAGIGLEHFAGDRISIGRYVLAGGELAAMVICDAVLRKLPGALGHDQSSLEESFSAALGGAPEYPHYTRPAEHRGWRVPEVLLSGHHARIKDWRLAQSRSRAAAADSAGHTDGGWVGDGSGSADGSLP